MTTPVANPAKLDITQRVSFLSNVSGAKDGEYENMKTPPAADIEGGALREGGAPNLFSREYIGVVTQYAAVGLIDAVLPATIYPFLQNYLNVEGKTYLTASTLVALPWSFKVFYGILSDCVPIFGYRRRPYMILGWSICIAMLFIMSFMPVGDPFWKYPDDASIDPETHPEDYAEARARANFAAPGKGGKQLWEASRSDQLERLPEVVDGDDRDGLLIGLVASDPLGSVGSGPLRVTDTPPTIVGEFFPIAKRDRAQRNLKTDCRIVPIRPDEGITTATRVTLSPTTCARSEKEQDAMVIGCTVGWKDLNPEDPVLQASAQGCVLLEACHHSIKLVMLVLDTITVHCSRRVIGHRREERWKQQADDDQDPGPPGLGRVKQVDRKLLVLRESLDLDIGSEPTRTFRKFRLTINLRCTCDLLLDQADREALLDGGVVPRTSCVGCTDYGGRRSCLLNTIMMLSAFGYLMSDVCADGVVVELAQREPLAVRGTTQATIYGTRTAFNIVGQLIVGFAFNGHQYGGNFDFSLSFTTLMLILAFCMAPMIFVTWFFIKEEKHEPMLFKPYVAELWRLVQLRAVYQVIFYQFFSNVFSAMSYTPASLVQRYLVHVTPINNTLSGILGNLTFLAGITITGKYGLHWNWRMIIVVTGVGVIALDSITTMITIWDVFRSQWLWLGLPIAIQVPAGISFLISTFVVVELAGEGNEGACYGLLTTVSNLAQPFAASLTKIIDRNWDFSDERIQRDTHDVRMDITWAVLIMYVSSIISWGFLYFLPSQKEATQKLKREGGSSRVLGAITVFYISFALVWSVMTNIMGIFDSTSCLIIAGGDGC
ncbi:hypothetical protein ATCC90586_008171 [Pythium insidiosum]|nr:hypothetical protein ATCC90586_008171 [Pythium insidiosum]